MFKQSFLINIGMLLILLFMTFPVYAEEIPLVDTLDIGNGYIDITADGLVVQNGKNYAFSMEKALVLTGESTTSSVRIFSGVGKKRAVSIRLDNLKVNTSEIDCSAFSILEGSSAEIILTPGTRNSLISADYYAGLQVQNLGGKVGKLRIGGSGTLDAIGGKNATGIGGANNVTHWYGTGGNITIEDGIITATGGSEGAGIGGAYKGNGGDITISGGHVTAIGGEMAAGIGGGHFGAAGNLNITSNMVFASSGNGGENIGNGADYEQKIGEEAVLEINMSSNSVSTPTPQTVTPPQPTPESTTEAPKTTTTSFWMVVFGIIFLVFLSLLATCIILYRKRKAKNSNIN